MAEDRSSEAFALLDLHALTPADVPAVVWDLDCAIVTPPPGTDLRGPQIQGSPVRMCRYRAEVVFRLGKPYGLVVHD